MVSDTELIGRLREFLSTSDLTTTTTATVRRKLEEDFGIDLSDKKGFIREQVDLYLETQFQIDNENNDEENNDDGQVKSEVSDEEEEEEEEVVVKVKRRSSKKKAVKKNENVKRKAGGFTKVCSLSPQLQKFTGEAELARTEVVKRMWNYIRENNLQDPSNRRNINCDDTLRELFDVDTIDMFQMNKALAKHIWALDSDASTITTSGSVNSTAKEKSSTSTTKKKRQKQEEDEDSDEPKRKEKRQNSGILAPIKLSDALIKFLGTGESELPRSNVVKKIWEYIKQNDLQDPSDKRKIICDEKLKELFHVDTFLGFGVMKLLTAHFIKAER
ncbi:upstream activation factor subunit UAF30-like isoform X2 [Lycium ferocissimum]|uniref:upstream activation factor subunit UAF30-like isoform X2 n=1 Tax=Lycium ferocissimum TaxID=112874 RepID=UPI0028160039|nr:upstream activation factor subunit UAF30-like isoform X2 [Lycium ferocissimum]